MIEQNLGAGWTIVPSPNASAFGGIGSLIDVACANPAHCVAVGSYEAENGHFQTLLEENVGHGWDVVPSPNLNPGEDNLLSGVACAGQSLCIAVGAERSGDHDLPLIEQNSGTGWTIVPTSGVGALSDIACPGAHQCIATGGDSSISDRTITEEPLIKEMANDGTWGTVAIPQQVGILGGVACPTPTYCVSVGNLLFGGLLTENPLIFAERTGNEWTTGPPSEIGSKADTFSAVACPEAGRCIAVGDRLLSSRYPGVRATFIAQHTSHGWMIQASPSV